MFKDIKLFVLDESIEYKYKIENGNIIIYDLEKIDNDLTIVYDENIYEIKLNNPYEEIYKGKSKVFKITSDFYFEVILNQKYFVKTVYNFINGFIDKYRLLEEINIFKNSNIGKSNEKILDKLISDIDNKDINDLLIDSDDEVEKINTLLLENELYNKYEDEMSNEDWMLLITYYIASPKVPNLGQDKFNEIVKSAIKSDHANENVWRLAMNYDCKEYDYSLIDEYFVNKKDIWYLGEYLSGVIQVDQNKIIDLIIKLNDHDYIDKILNDKLIMTIINDELKEKLKLVI